MPTNRIPLDREAQRFRSDVPSAARQAHDGQGRHAFGETPVAIDRQAARRRGRPTSRIGDHRLRYARTLFRLDRIAAAFGIAFLLFTALTDLPVLWLVQAFGIAP